MRRLALSIILLSALLLVACGEEESPPPVATEESVDTPVPTEEASAETEPPAPTPTPTPRPSPTPEPAELDVEAQDVDLDGELTVTASLASPGWVAVYTTDEEGEPLTRLGVAAVPAGPNQSITLTVDPFAMTDTLLAILYQDNPPADEFTAADTAVAVDGTPLQAAFEVTLDVPMPQIAASEQTIGEEGLVTIDEVIAPEAGWLALYADEEGEWGDLLAFAGVEAGRNENVVLDLIPLYATPVLHAVLHQDQGEMGRFEPEVDPPLAVSGEPLAVAFPVALPLDAFALDQPVVDGTVVVERAVVNQPAWLAIYYSAPDRENRIIGFSLLEPGINENIVVEVEEALLTAELLIIFHVDAEDPGVFEFPGADEPILVDGRLPEPFSFRTDQGSYLVAMDQPLDESSLTFPLVVTTAPSWLVVYGAEEGERASVLGRVLLARGINRDVTVTVGGNAAPGDTVIAVLHADRGAEGAFEPLDADVPLQRNGNDIAVPLQILE